MNINEKSITKKIMIVIVIVMLCNFVMPNYIYALDGGELFKYVVPVILMIPDLLINKLQQIFISEESEIGIKDPEGGISNYYILYSPGVIFSGTVPGLDVNFISPMGENGKKEYKIKQYGYKQIGKKGDFEYEDLVERGLRLDNSTEGTNYSDTLTYTLWFGKDIAYITWTDDRGTEDVTDDITYWHHLSTTTNMPVALYWVAAGVIVIGGLLITYALKGLDGGTATTVSVATAGKVLAAGGIMLVGTATTDYLLQTISSAISGGTLYEVIKEKDINSTRYSIAYSLRNTVATYYKVMQEVALVILLSVLVYVAIRMILTSSANDKAKYKKMMWDWFCAICILFILHFFMSAVLTTIQRVNEIFSSAIINTEGADVLMSSVRTKIGFDPAQEDMSETFSSVIIYIVLVVYTIQYTVIYLKRVIHIAFLMMIAPMVAFTYPIDKMKDGKAQALSLWLKEFTFNALMQPIHMILYYIFIDGAMGLATTNVIYAIVMIGFLKPAEKFVRQIFGLEEDSSLGKMASALGGAAIMSGVGKVASKAAKGVTNFAKKQAGKSQDKKIRTQENSGTQGSGTGSSGTGTTGTGS